LSEPGREEEARSERGRADIESEVLSLNAQVLPLCGEYATLVVFDSGSNRVGHFSLINTLFYQVIESQRRGLKIFNQFAPMRNDRDTSHMRSLLCDVGSWVLAKLQSGKEARVDR